MPGPLAWMDPPANPEHVDRSVILDPQGSQARPDAKVSVETPELLVSEEPQEEQEQSDPQVSPES